MKHLELPIGELRKLRNSKLYRPLARLHRVYTRYVVDGLHARGFEDFSPAFPQLLSNLDTEGTRIGVLAARAGVTRQAAGQLLTEIERCGYIERRAAEDDARATIVMFTARGRELLTTIFSLCDTFEANLARVVGAKELSNVRVTLMRLADAVDEGGALGQGDENARNKAKAAR